MKQYSETYITRIYTIGMKDRLDFGLGVIFCLIGAIILISSLLGRIISGGFILLVIGIFLISESIKNLVNK
jgi:multisubunit Na+/H+ antiporter MnhG subunit